MFHICALSDIYTYVVNKKMHTIRICIFYLCALAGLIHKFKYKKSILRLSYRAS